MLFEIMERNKGLLQGTGSYLLPRLDKIIDLLRTVENSAGTDFFNSIRHVEFTKGDFLVREGAVCRNLLLLEKYYGKKWKQHLYPWPAWPGKGSSRI